MAGYTVWEFIPLTEYEWPPEQSPVVRLDWIKRNGARTRMPDHPEGLPGHPAWRDDWVGPIDWESAAKAFDGALAEWSHKPPRAGSAQVSVGLFGSAEQVLRAWTGERAATVLEPPSINQLLDGSAEVWPALRDGGDGVFVLPALERCFLRRHRGLRLVRQIIETVWEKPRQLVIGCDVWAWNYLQKAVQLDTVCRNPLMCAPLDANRLRRWLPSLASDNGVRVVVDGKDCFAPDSAGGERVLVELAAGSRGVATLAWSLWRSMLQECPRERSQDAVEFDLTSFAGSPISAMRLPDTRLTWYVLHTLLLHAGLPVGVLPNLLPFGATQIWQTLSQLRGQDLVIEEQGLWRVAAKSYSEVCRRLAGVGFWVGEI